MPDPMGRDKKVPPDLERSFDSKKKGLFRKKGQQWPLFFKKKGILNVHDQSDCIKF
jgi:hypothetical protein